MGRTKIVFNRKGGWNQAGNCKAIHGGRRYIDCWMSCGVHLMAQMTKLPLLALGCLAVTVIAYWQSSFDAPPAAPPATLVLKPAAAAATNAVAATNNEVTAAAPSKKEAAPAPVKDTATAPAKKAAARVK